MRLLAFRKRLRIVNSERRAYLLICTIKYNMGKEINDLLVLKKELQHYKRMRVVDSVEEKKYTYEEVQMRPLSVFEVDENEAEDRVFLIEFGDRYKLVGYKILVDYFKNKGNGFSDIDSRITVDMLLGIYEKIQIEKGKVSIKFYSLESSEKRYIFNLIKRKVDVEICYPIVLKTESCRMPRWEEIWAGRSMAKTEEENIEFLSNTEPHLRKYTEEVLKKNDMHKFVIYDPACSTGEFLEYVKQKFKDAYTIGHDMDENMINIAKKRVDEFACCNAFESSIESEYVDVLALRFLNYAVVNRVEAEKLFKQLVKKVKKGGLVVCFGHTPVLLSGLFFEEYTVEIIGKVGYEEASDSIFQYYAMRV